MPSVMSLADSVQRPSGPIPHRLGGIQGVIHDCEQRYVTTYLIFTLSQHRNATSVSESGLFEGVGVLAQPSDDDGIQGAVGLHRRQGLVKSTLQVAALTHSDTETSIY